MTNFKSNKGAFFEKVYVSRFNWPKKKVSARKTFVMAGACLLALVGPPSLVAIGVHQLDKLPIDKLSGGQQTDYCANMDLVTANNYIVGPTEFDEFVIYAKRPENQFAITVRDFCIDLNRH